MICCYVRIIVQFFIFLHSFFLIYLSQFIFQNFFLIFLEADSKLNFNFLVISYFFAVIFILHFFAYDFFMSFLAFYCSPFLTHNDQTNLKKVILEESWFLFIIFYIFFGTRYHIKKGKNKKKWVAYKYFGFTIFLSTGFARVMLLLTLFHSLLLFIIFIFISLSLFSPFFFLFFDILFCFIFSSHFFSHPKIRKLAILKNWKK